MGTLSSLSLNPRITIQWSQIKTQPITIIKNNHSHQQFLIHSIPNTQTNHNKLYLIRQFSCLPYTPKVICLQKQQNHFIFMVEKSEQLLAQWLQQITNQLAVLIKLNEVLHGFWTLKNRFGTFIITQKMIHLSVNQKVMVWYNQKFQSNIIQLPLSGQKTKIQSQDNESLMVRNIIEIFRKNTFFSKHLLFAFSKVKTFKLLHQIVKRRIHQIQTTNTSQNLIIKPPFEKYAERQQKSLIHPKTYHKKNSSISYQNTNTQNQKNTALLIKKSSSNLTKQKSFLLQQTQRIKENQIFQQFQSKHQYYTKKSKQEILSKNELTNSERYSSSNVSSKQYIDQIYLKKDEFKAWKSFHQNSLSKNASCDQSMFRRKQCGYRNLQIYEGNQNQRQRCAQQKYLSNQQSDHVYFSPTFKCLSPSGHVYKACQSFSSIKQFSLKSTTGTLKKTREFSEQVVRQMTMCQRETIKQQSDETHKNSNNYSVQTIKEELKQEQKCSLSVSQDFHQLFSGRESNGCDEQNESRFKEFQKVLWEEE